MAEVPKNPIIAVRKVEFSENDFRESNIMRFPENFISQEEWFRFSANALVLTCKNDILQYACEYPIVRYECNQGICNEPEGMLNTFIKNITVSTATDGKKVTVKTGKIESEVLKNETIAYYEDAYEIYHSITNRDIFMLLLKKPNLVVSPEGVLVFYTEKSILCTLDCESCLEIKINESKGNINTIDVFDDFIEVVYDDDDEIYAFEINFDFDFNSSFPVIPVITRIK